MSDFLLDLRPRGTRALARAAEQLRFVDGASAWVFDEADFGLALTHTGAPALWAPYRSEDGSVVAVAGRVALEELEWESGEAIAGSGGLAAKVMYAQYQRFGAAALERLNGNFAVILFDAARRQLHLTTDYCGAFPTFGTDGAAPPLYGSHPDVLAAAADVAHRLDEASLAEFILSGTVTPPFSYYERVRALDHGIIFTFDFNVQGPPQPVKKRYFEFAYRGDPKVQQDDLAQELAAALQRAVQRRTLPRLGVSAVALSGGLDSRVILAFSPGKARTFAFTCYDEPNLEFRTAEAIAQSLSVPFRPLRRGYEYYGDHAELGVRISGGMGTFANNHFLGVMPPLKAAGMQNLLTGCYCDYLFKALPLNLTSHWLTRREKLGPFRDEFYFDHFHASSKLADGARERWKSRVPRRLQNQDDAATVFEIETRRTFPLCYEGDNQQRLVPQRVTGWAPPFADREVLDLYCRIPYQFKLNRSLFRKVALVFAKELGAIPDANTGAPADANPAWEWLQVTRGIIRRKWERFRGSSTSDESWPNWLHYVRHSQRLDALWKRPNPGAIDLFCRVLGPKNAPGDVEELKRDRPYLFIGLLSLKLWLDQRA